VAPDAACRSLRHAGPDRTARRTRRTRGTTLSGVHGARAPKLVAPEKQIDFGKQPQNKNLVRPIVIKNGGRADLNIESVVPS